MPESGRFSEEHEGAAPIKSLVVTLTLPWPARTSGDLRTWSTIGALAQHGPVAVFGVEPRPPVTAPVRGIEVWRSSTDAALADPRVHATRALKWLHDPQGHPSDRWFSPVAERELWSLARRFKPDVVVLEHLFTRRYLAAARSGGGAVVLNSHDVADTLRSDPTVGVETGLSARNLTERLAERVALIERLTIAAVDQTWVGSKQDAVLIADRYGKRLPVEIVPSGVDLPQMHAPNLRDPRLMIYPGSFNYAPNAAAARRLVNRILPSVRVRHPTARLCLVGAGLSSGLVSASGVEAPGAVPAMRPFLARASVMPVPVNTGGGTRLKVIEALGAGVVIVSTPKGVERLRLRHGEHVLLADSDDDFAERITEVWEDERLRTSLVINGQALVRDRYSMESVKRAVSEALGRLLGEER